MEADLEFMDANKAINDLKTDEAWKEKRRETWRETLRLLNEATMAVQALSNHLEQVGDKPRLYIANRAIRALWEIE